MSRSALPASVPAFTSTPAIRGTSAEAQRPVQKHPVVVAVAVALALAAEELTAKASGAKPAGVSTTEKRQSIG